jgi:hypothetical protein
MALAAVGLVATTVTVKVQRATMVVVQEAVALLLT